VTRFLRKIPSFPSMQKGAQQLSCVEKKRHNLGTPFPRGRGKEGEEKKGGSYPTLQLSRALKLSLEKPSSLAKKGQVWHSSLRRKKKREGKGQTSFPLQVIPVFGVGSYFISTCGKTKNKGQAWSVSGGEGKEGEKTPD